MNRIRRARRGLPRTAGRPGTGQPCPSQPSGQEPRPSNDAIAARGGQDRPAATTTSSRWRAITAPSLLLHTIQLCIHCRYNPAGFWVSHTSDQTTRRPWCLTCCQNLDPDTHHIKPFR